MNELFLKQMKELLGDEYDAYLALLERDEIRGFRINTLKCTPEVFFEHTSWKKQATPFAHNGYYYLEDNAPGRTPAWHAGLAYMQEPSASAAVTVLQPRPGMNILDLCAAPGSKTTQIAEYMQSQGFLVANEINAQRASVLKENVERHGITNCMVISAKPEDVADAFEGFFDQVLCDAPCSGEGMMRKEEAASAQWTPELVAHCAAVQKTVLAAAYRCLRPGGTLVYSTCTLNTQENEENIAWFLSEYPDMHTESCGVDFGRAAFEYGNGTSLARRIYPMDGGEGHFICRMRKDGDVSAVYPGLLHSAAIPGEVLKAYRDIFADDYPYYYFYKNQFYGGSAPFVQAGRCRLIRHQVHLGEWNGKRFEPSYAAFAANNHPARRQIELNDEDTMRYLHGETISVQTDKGYVGVCWKGHVLGGGRSDGTMIKNRYPKGYRSR